MPRYIDADKLEELCDIMAEKCGGIGNFIWHQFCIVVESRPTVDAVEVVRCRDCKHKEGEQPGMVYCPMMVGSWVADDHFCKWAERREDAEVH